MYTRKLLGFLETGFKYIGRFTCSPWLWASGECDDNRNFNSGSGSNLASAIILGSIDGSCGAIRCCCRAPAACVCFAVTAPLGGSTAVLFGTLGGVGLCCTAIADTPEKCCSTTQHDSKNGGSSMVNQADTKNNISATASRNINLPAVPSNKPVSIMAIRPC